MTPLKKLKEAEKELKEARAAAAEAAAKVERCEHLFSDAQMRVNVERERALVAVKPRKILYAYALWLFTPFVWPGAYLFYLGRDAHALLHTVSFGGFGIGWLLDGFYIPHYVADHNEPPGYIERVSSKESGWRLSSLFGLLLSPLSLALQFALALFAATICAYLVPRPLVFPAELGIAPLSRVASASVGFSVGMAAVAICIKLGAAPLAHPPPSAACFLCRHTRCASRSPLALLSSRADRHPFSRPPPVHSFRAHLPHARLLSLAAHPPLDRPLLGGTLSQRPRPLCRGRGEP